MRQVVFAVALFLLSASCAPAAVFQYATPVETRQGERMAYLWVPPKAEQIRGVVMGGMTLMEREFAQDARIRAACAEEQLAIVFLKCGLGATDIQHVLDRFARVSGYQELSVAPLMFVGHSAGGPQARLRAREFADRCFGLVQYRGADPGDVDHDGTEGIPPGIPALMMIGQFDEFGKIGRDENGIENWEKDRDKLALFRTKNQRNLGSILVEPGAGHFAWSDRNAEYLALFLPRAARARIPASWPMDARKPVALIPVDPASGWLTDLTIKTPGKFAPAPYSQYQGDKENAAWHFDKTMAEATVAYHQGIERQDQFITWNDPHKVSAGARNFFDRIAWIGDGQTFEVHPAYAKIYPQQSSGRGARWGKAGEAVGHAHVPIRIKQVSGPIIAVGNNTFRVRYNELAPAAESARVTFMAFSEGDDEYRYTERVGMISQLALTAGKPQTLTFPSIGNLQPDSPPVELKAAADSGLPVEYHIAFGPARIADGKLAIAELPGRTSYPIVIKVVAYQFGRGADPLVQAASPVEQSLEIRRP
ncbi:hypothetical protein Pla8534_00420 [Lignipirellula cremea]|uniref:Alpha/beta hydrolase family protein n=1 Tax=Lignipirellula cremea TaxID=2528010 RepID=A0A518DKD7_9BACT|nr:hypothetical protein Pla8534_00420 [Lignipirellula cremea]